MLNGNPSLPMFVYNEKQEVLEAIDQFIRENTPDA